MQDIEMILSVSHIMSLSGVIPTFEQFMTTWEDLSNKNPCLPPMIQQGLEWAYMYYAWMDCTHAYTIAMGNP